MARDDTLFNQQEKAVSYHSNYDSYYWPDKFGDVGFTKHKAMSRLWGLIAVRLAGIQLIPFKVVDYPRALARNVIDLKKKPWSTGSNVAGGSDRPVS